MLNPPGPQAGANGPFRRFSTDFSTGECMSGKTSIAVLGGGSWGTALAHLLAHAGHSVALLLRDAEQAAHINAHHENPRYLRGVQLHPGIRLLPGIRAVRNRRKCWRASPCWSCRSLAKPCGGRFAGWRALCPRTAFLSIRQKESKFPSWLRWSAWSGKSCPDSWTATPSFPGRRSPLRWRPASPRRWCSAAATNGLGHG